MDPQTKNPAIAALTAITKMASTANPAAGLWIIFYGAGSMQKIDKFFVRQQLVRVAGRGESLQAAVTPAELDV
ncbi:hypothetical protein ACU6VJ_02080 [Sphaerotilus sulfidivorans]